MAVGLVPIARRAFAGAARGTPFSIETLMTIAAVGAVFIGAAEEDQPETSVNGTYAVFADRLEAEVLAWGACAEALTRCEAELGDWRRKSDDVYRMAAATADGDPPRIFTDLIDAVRARA